jgi:hypothetical protein
MHLQRGYTIVEVAIVIFLVSVLSATSVFILGSSKTTGSDALAQATADSTIDAALNILIQDGSLDLASTARLALENPGVNIVAPTVASVGDSYASVSVKDGVVAVAVLGTDGSCWMLRQDMTGGTSLRSRQYVLVTDASSRPCSGNSAWSTDALALSAKRGKSWSRPVVWGATSAGALDSASVIYRAASATAGTQTLKNEGTAGPLLNATLGSSSSADSLDPTVLMFEGYPYLYLSGASGNAVTSPSSSAANVTTDLQLQAKIEPDDLTPTASQAIVAKYSPSGAQYAYALILEPTGSLSLKWASAVAPSVAITATSTASLTTQTLTKLWVKASAVTSSTTNTVSFYTSSEGSQWTKLGSDVVVSSSAPLNQTATQLTVGSYGDYSSPFIGKIYKAEIRSSSGVLRAAFDPTDCTTSGLTCTGTSNETWSVQRAAVGKQSAIVTRTTLLMGSSILSAPSSTLADLSSTGYLTVVLALRYYSSATDSVLVGKFDNAASSKAGWAVSPSAGGMRAIASSTGLSGSFIAATVAPVEGTPSVLAARYAAPTRTVKVWANTVSQSTTGLSNPWAGLSNTHYLALGGSMNSAGSVSAHSSYELLGFALFNTSLTDEEVARAGAELQRSAS